MTTKRIINSVFQATKKKSRSSTFWFSTSACSTRDAVVAILSIYAWRSFFYPTFDFDFFSLYFVSKLRRMPFRMSFICSPFLDANVYMRFVWSTLPFITFVYVIFAQSKTWRKEYKDYNVRFFRLVNDYCMNAALNGSNSCCFSIPAIVCNYYVIYTKSFLLCQNGSADFLWMCVRAWARVCGWQYGNWADNKTWSGPSTLKLIWTALLCERVEYRWYSLSQSHAFPHLAIALVLYLIPRSVCLLTLNSQSEQHLISHSETSLPPSPS